MKNYFRTKRLNILALLAGFTYAFLVVNTIVSDWDDSKRGFTEGWESAGNRNPGSFERPLNSYHLLLKLKDDIVTYPDSMVNQKDHTTLKSIPKHVIALSPSHLPTKYSGWYSALFAVIGMLVVITYFLIPFYFYRLIGLIKKGIIFEQENIRLIRKLGIGLLVVYFGNVLYNFISYQVASSLFSFSNYEIQIHSMDAIWLLFGIVVLLVAEILSRAIALKEEHELTI